MHISEKQKTNKEPKLTKRLLLAAEYVRNGKKVADVGCDHGKLSAFLLLSEKTPFVYATDIREKPLQKTEKLLSELCLDGKYCCMKTDGLSGIPAGAVDDIVMAGIGADVISHIISEAEWIKNNNIHLVLVPASKRERLRRFIASEGFEIEREEAVTDHGHSYAVMSVYYTGKKRELSVKEAWLGKIDTETADGKIYLAQIKDRMKNVIEAVEDINNEHRREAVRFMEELDDHCSTT